MAWSVFLLKSQVCLLWNLYKWRSILVASQSEMQDSPATVSDSSIHHSLCLLLISSAETCLTAGLDPCRASSECLPHPGQVTWPSSSLFAASSFRWPFRLQYMSTEARKALMCQVYISDFLHHSLIVHRLRPITEPCWESVTERTTQERILGNEIHLATSTITSRSYTPCNL